MKEKTKNVRNETKKKVNDLIKKIFIYPSKEANENIYQMYDILKSIEKIIIMFSEQYQKNKLEKNIIDFTDIEHFTLNILVKKDESNNYIPTEVAKKYKDKFKEIAIDEYQDSNLVQEYILKTISNGNNIFMVGDVKQSIYKFRQARPELFLEKYNSYTEVKDDNKECEANTKIQLFKNFRSRQSVLDTTNFIFNCIMSKKMGDIDYNENEYLNRGIEYPKPNNKIDFAGDTEIDIIDLEKEVEEINEIDEMLEKTEIEARFVANKIRDILQKNYCIYDKKQGYRKATFKDFVILLRTTNNTANIYQKELEKLDIPVFTDISQSYLESEEIETIMALLKIIDNPNTDIPLVSVLRSIIGEFTDNELLEIRLYTKDGSFYEAMNTLLKNSNNKKLKFKIKSFFDNLNVWQQKQEILSLDELIWYLYQTTGYYDFVSSMPNGDIKIGNLKLLFEKAKDYEEASFKGLYNFINYIEKVKRTSGDTSSAKLISENENVIRIMSIHKSKGLEFPIVFLCGTGKQFNMQDLSQNILLHQDIGFGPKYINYERRIEYTTAAKEAMKIKIKNEILSEEMRLLYVALTRAKEKIVITGVENDLKKSIDWKEKSIDITQKKISPIIIKKAKSYLDWLEMVCIKNNKRIIHLNIHNRSTKLINKKEVDKNIIKNDNKIKLEKNIDELLSWKYPYIDIAQIEGKTSVSKISKINNEENIDISTKPKFLERKQLASAEKGTLMHLVFQKIDLNNEYTKEKIKLFINNMVNKEIITLEEADNIDVEKIEKFTKTNLFERIKNAKFVYREQPFYITIPLRNIQSIKSDEKVLVQGIIDLYFIEENGKTVLVDYKTDYVEKSEKELIDKHCNQLGLYKKALEKALGKEVDETYIYSIFLNKEIRIF